MATSAPMASAATIVAVARTARGAGKRSGMAIAP